ncbi:MAG: S41 family peptidase [Elusimicrobia bacterium]|nr:S41 family peptidase [Elusimicrobiota bacterium]
MAVTALMKRRLIAAGLIFLSLGRAFGKDDGIEYNALNHLFDRNLASAVLAAPWLPWVWQNKGCASGQRSPASTPGPKVDVPVEIDPSQETNVSTTALHDIGMVMEHIHENYPEAVGDEQLIEAATEGMLKSLDPYSGVVDSEERKSRDAIYKDQSNYSGTGIAFQPKNQDQYPVVYYTYPESPAYLAGIRSGDALLAVDGLDVRGLSLDEIVEKIQGPEGSEVSLAVVSERPPAAAAPRQVALRRTVFALANVYFEMAAYRVGYVDIRGFHEKTAGDVERAIVALKKEGMRRLIIDLRGNTGGRVSAAEDMAKQFLKKGDIVVQVAGKNSSSSVATAQDGPFVDMPLAILVDYNTASSSELFAGALQAHGRALLAGSQTHGKGIIQHPKENFPFPGHTTWMTQERYYFVNGRTVGYPQTGDNGLVPDIVVTNDASLLEKIENDRLMRMMRQPLPNPTPDEVLRAAVRYFYAQAVR